MALKKLLVLFFLIAFFTVSGQGIPEDKISFEMDYLNDLYVHLHRHPELSLQERETSRRMAEELRAAGFEVTENIGGYGLFGVYNNGEGPVILVRTDMDGLPVKENTGLPFTSHEISIDHDGNEVGVMHACGHDIHMSVWTGTARVLTSMSEQWQGTLVFVAQGAEEMGLGSKAMIDAGLFSLIPEPDYNLAIHDDPLLRAGTVGICPGYAFANVDMIDINVFGAGGHGAMPQNTIDPVVLSAKIILELQTIISRQISPLDPAVITVGKIEGGTVGNVIPEMVHMELTVRSFKDEVRNGIIERIRKASKGVAATAGLPDDRLPEVIVRDQFTPSLYNDPELSDRIFIAFKECLGPENVFSTEPQMIGEDFSRYGRYGDGIPSLMFRLGTTEEKLFKRAQKGEAEVPGLHSDRFKPDHETTIFCGVKAMSCAVLDLLNRE